VQGFDKFHRPLKIIGQTAFVGIDEDQIKRANLLFGKAGQGIDRTADSDIDRMG